MLARGGFPKGGLFGLSNLGQREWAILLMVLVVALGGLWYYLLLVPMGREIAQVQSEIDQLSLQKTRGLQARRSLPELRNALATLQAERAQFLRALPQEEQLYAVLNELFQEALRSGVVIKSFTRSPTSSPVPEVRAVNLTFQLQAPFSETYAFLRRLEGLSRFSTIPGLSMSASSQELNPLLDTSFTLTVYTLAPGARGNTPGEKP
ncbi:MAG: type 4a pilus biogenesis protein PilO [Thermaceae bacterium]